MGNNESIEVVPIKDSIRLGQFLKFANLVDSGAMARQVITDGLVQVDGEVETRRGRQLVAGQIVSFGGQQVQVG